MPGILRARHEDASRPDSRRAGGWQLIFIWYNIYKVVRRFRPATRPVSDRIFGTKWMQPVAFPGWRRGPRNRSGIFFSVGVAPSPIRLARIRGPLGRDRPEFAPSINLAELAKQYEMSGASILNAMHFSALQAYARGNGVLTHADLLDGLRKEYLKEEKSI